MKFFRKMKERKKEAKNQLLRAYISSLLSLVLCVCMFCGTSYAWFSSDVSVEGNEIYIGMLDVDLLMDGKSLSAPENKDLKVYSNAIRWEAGYTSLRTFTVKDEGNLAFNYELTFTDATTTVTGGDVNDIAKWFSVYVTDKQVTATSFEQIAKSPDWTYVDTLDKVLAGKPVFSGTMTQEQVNATEPVTHTYTVALHMLENATGEGIMGQSLGLNVKLTAYQKSAEEDSFGKSYDNLIKTPDELKAAFAQGGKAILLADIDMGTDALTLPKGKSLTLDLNGYDITRQSLGKADSMISVNNGATLNIQDTSANADGVILHKVVADKNCFTVHCEGQLNLYSGTLAQTNGGSITITVDVRPNAWGTAFDSPTVFNMYGGKLDGADNHAIRLAVNSSESYVNDAATCVIHGGEIVGRDGVFMQMFENNMGTATYRPLNLTVNGGTINGTNAAIRVYAPTPEKVVGADETPINITLNGGTFTSNNNDGSEVWLHNGAIKIQNTSGGTVAQITDRATIEYNIS